MTLLRFITLLVPLFAVNPNSSVSSADVTTITFSSFESNNGSASIRHQEGDWKTTSTADIDRLWTVSNKIGITISSDVAFDEEVTFDGAEMNKVWRVSNAVTSMILSHQPFSPSSSLVAGESTAVITNGSDALNAFIKTSQSLWRFAETPYFHSYLRFRSATGSAQPGLTVGLSASPKQGDIRLSHIVISDNGDSGLDVFFYDASETGILIMRKVVANLSYSEWHELDVYMTFVDGLNVDGSGNDEVNVYVDGRFIHTGTSCETMYHQENQSSKHSFPYAVDSLMFQLSGNAAPNTKGGGLFFDDVVVNNAVVPSDKPSSSPNAESTLVKEARQLQGTTNSPTVTVTPTSFPTGSFRPSANPSKATQNTADAQNVEVVTCGSCNQSDANRMADTTEAVCEEDGYVCELESFTTNCSANLCGGEVSGIGRVVRLESFTIIFRVSKITTDQDDTLDPTEAVGVLNSNAARVSTILSQELGIDIVVREDARIIEAPSSAPSQSPAPSISQIPSVSLSPTLRFKPSAIPTNSQYPSLSPTTRSSRTFQIISFFYFDDSGRDFCLNAMKFKVGRRVKMRPCRNSFSKQLWYLDEFDQLRLRQRPNFCLTYRKREIKLGTCSDDGNTARAKFLYDKVKGVVFVQKRKRILYLGVDPTNKYGALKLFLEGQNESLDKWRFT